MQREWCRNMNHRRSDAPVRHCPNCGGTVNMNIPAKKCNDNEYAESRMNKNKYYVRG